MTSKNRNILYIVIVVLIVLAAIFLFSKKSAPIAPTPNPSAGLAEKADAFNAVIADELPKEKEVLKKEEVQAKSIDSDQTVINEFKYIYDQTAGN